MGDSLFPFEYLDFFRRPDRWKIVSSLFGSDHEPMEAPEREAWSNTHRDCHPSREIMIALEGESVHCLDDCLYPCSPGTVFLFNRFEFHDMGYAEDADKLIHLWLYLSNEAAFARLLRVERGRMNFMRPPMVCPRPISRLLNSIWDAVERSNDDRDLRRIKLLGAIQIASIQMLERPGGKQEKKFNLDHQEKVIQIIVGHIEETSGKGLTIENLARLAGYSKFHFLRLFRKYTGQTVHAYINGAKIDKAAEMIHTGHLKKEIADELGFSCPAALSNWMKRQREKGVKFVI